MNKTYIFFKYIVIVATRKPQKAEFLVPNADVAGVATWDVPAENAFGISTSLYESNPYNGERAGLPIQIAFTLVQLCFLYTTLHQLQINGIIRVMMLLRANFEDLHTTQTKTNAYCFK